MYMIYEPENLVLNLRFTWLLSMNTCVGWTRSCWSFDRFLDNKLTYLSSDTIPWWDLWTYEIALALPFAFQLFWHFALAINWHIGFILVTACINNIQDAKNFRMSHFMDIITLDNIFQYIFFVLHICTYESLLRNY